MARGKKGKPGPKPRTPTFRATLNAERDRIQGKIEDKENEINDLHDEIDALQEALQSIDDLEGNLEDANE